MFEMQQLRFLGGWVPSVVVVVGDMNELEGLEIGTVEDEGGREVLNV